LFRLCVAALPRDKAETSPTLVGFVLTRFLYGAGFAVLLAPLIGRPPAPETITFAFCRSLKSTLSREWEP
jgi:hypothetical protein